ncbi:hypothetical protein [Sphingomonas sp. LR55]
MAGATPAEKNFKAGGPLLRLRIGAAAFLLVRTPLHPDKTLAAARQIIGA